MDLIQDQISQLSELPRAPVGTTAERTLSRLLLGRTEDVEFPSATDLASAAIALATGAKRRVLLPLATTPGELALERRGDDVMVSVYSTTSLPDVALRERKVSLAQLLAASANAARSQHELMRDGSVLGSVIASRAAETSVTKVDADEHATIRGCTADTSKRPAPISFEFEATLRGATRGTGRNVRADIHALLFDGVLTAHVHGRKLVLARGSIMLAVLRMLSAARTVQDAQSARKVPNVRSRAGSFAIALRANATGTLALTLDGERGTSITAADLAPHDALLPIARLAAEIVRSLIAFDRTQAKNLRVQSIREDVRALRRVGRAREERAGFTNDDPDRLRKFAPAASTNDAAPYSRPSPSTLRFGERWRVALDGLDAAGTFLCGDRLVVSSSKHTVALSRDDGAVIWAREAAQGVCSLAGDVLVRSFPDGLVELCSVRDGEPFAETRIALRGARPSVATLVGGASTPPVAVFREGPAKLAAVDLRTGELVWRFRSRQNSELTFARLGRLLFIASGDAIHALDAITGEEQWRHVDVDAGVASASLAVSGDTVFCTYEGATSTLVGLDAFGGEVTLRRTFAGAPRGALLAYRGGVIISASAGSEHQMTRFDASGEVVFTTVDPGITRGAGSLVVDDRLIVNSRSGHVTATELEDGSGAWSARVARPNDDAPTMLDPVLRAGVLFVPSAEVMVLRPSDGSLANAGFPCDLIPDRLLVDERSWVYIAEESGHLAAHAPVAHLTLIRGGVGTSAA